MFGNNDQTTKDETVPTMGPVTDDMVSDDKAAVASPFDGSNVALPSNDSGSDEPVGSPVPSQPADDQLNDHMLSAGGTDELVHIKQEALQQLSPLVGHLDQTPEEKFRTTMMMIQATDDQSLVKDAYEAAKAISDDKVRAQALLDIVNEINYFTQQAKTS